MVLAVLDKRGRVPVGRHDVYVATVGGVRLTEPAADLATALAVASAFGDRPLVEGTVAIGEVGLTGEIRQVTGVRRRLEEAHRLGFAHALVPPGNGPYPIGIEVTEVTDVHSALRRLTQVAAPREQVVAIPTRLELAGVPRLRG
jgi:DNA repair protein RadA/Sms